MSPALPKIRELANFRKSGMNPALHKKRVRVENKE
jgi:hypothetical protein